VRLHVENVDFWSTQFAEMDCVEVGLTRGVLKSSLRSCQLSAAPPGKHDLSKCEGYEAAWRRAVPDVLDALKGGESLVLWLTGPMESDGLPLAILYVVESHRFHIDAMTCLNRAGYITGCVAFEFQRDSFAVMVNDDELDFEFINIAGITVTEDTFAETIVRPFDKIGAPWVVQHGGIAFVHTRHFEGINIFGLPSSVRSALARVATLFDVDGSL